MRRRIQWKDAKKALELRSVRNASTGCLEWTRGKNKDGYGYICIDGTALRAHRVSWMLEHGQIERGKIVCHRCDNPSCIAVEHLFIGTDRDNINDKLAKGRGHNTAGERNAQAKLSSLEVRIIRLLSGGDLLQKQIAALFGITQTTVSGIQRGVSWRSLWQP